MGTGAAASGMDRYTVVCWGRFADASCDQLICLKPFSAYTVTVVIYKRVNIAYFIFQRFASTSVHKDGVLFLDLLGSDDVLEALPVELLVEDGSVPLCYPFPITPDLHDATVSISIEETNQQAGGRSPSPRCTWKYHRRKLTSWQEPGPPRSKGSFSSRHCHFSQCGQLTLTSWPNRAWWNTLASHCATHFPSPQSWNHFRVQWGIYRWVQSWFGYQFRGALEGIAITDEAGDRNGRHAGLEVHRAGLWISFRSDRC